MAVDGIDPIAPNPASNQEPSRRPGYPDSTWPTPLQLVENGEAELSSLSGGPGRIRRRVAAQFREFVTREDVGEFRPNQWEATYINDIPKGTVWNSPADWSFFKPLGAVPTLPGVVEGESFSGEWHFVIPGKRGRLHASWQHGLLSPGAQERGETIRLTLTARGPIGTGGDPVQTALDGVDLGRETIVSSFRALMSDAANSYWGLRK